MKTAVNSEEMVDRAEKQMMQGDSYKSDLRNGYAR